MKKGLVLLLLLLSIPSVYARDVDDPCGEIVGGWTGTWKAEGGECLWNAKVDSSTYHGVVRFITEINLAKGSDCIKTNSFVMMGTCKDGILDFDLGYKGYVFGGVVTLRKAVYAAVLKKEIS